MRTHYFATPSAIILLVAIFLLAAPAARADVDYGDASSATLTAKAWSALGIKKYADTIAYTSKCIDSYKTIALGQQKALSSTHPADKANWALNDVATCYYIQGMAKEGLGKITDAMADYKYLIDHFTMAQCYDAKGFSWSPSKPAKERLGALLVDHNTVSVITKIDLDSITIKTPTAVSTYRITPSTKINFKGQPSNLMDIQPGMAVEVATGADENVADSISADDPPSK